MRVGDARRIESLVTNGYSDEAIVKRFINDYSEEETMRFIAHAKLLKKGAATVKPVEPEEPVKASGTTRAKNK